MYDVKLLSVVTFEPHRSFFIWWWW